MTGAGAAYSAVWKTPLTSRRCGFTSQEGCCPTGRNTKIFNAERRLLATAVETGWHTRLKLLSKSMPDTRVFAVTTAVGEPAGFLIKQTLYGPV
jgi:hypothetical protein